MNLLSNEQNCSNDYLNGSFSFFYFHKISEKALKMKKIF